MFEIDPAWLALIGTVIATIGLKVVERWLGKKDRNTTDATQIRSELRDQVASLKKEVSELEAEVEEWKGRYYDTREELAHKKLDLQIALEKIKTLTHQAQQIIDDDPTTP